MDSNNQQSRTIKNPTVFVVLIVCIGIGLIAFGIFASRNEKKFLAVQLVEQQKRQEENRVRQEEYQKQYQKQQEEYRQQELSRQQRLNSTNSSSAPSQGYAQNGTQPTATTKCASVNMRLTGSIGCCGDLKPKNGICVRVPYIAILYPISGATFKSGDSVTIRWGLADIGNDIISKLSIYLNFYKEDYGSIMIPIANDVANTGTYNWVVGDEPSSAAYNHKLYPGTYSIEIYSRIGQNTTGDEISGKMVGTFKVQ